MSHRLFVIQYKTIKIEEPFIIVNFIHYNTVCVCVRVESSSLHFDGRQSNFSEKKIVNKSKASGHWHCESVSEHIHWQNVFFSVVFILFCINEHGLNVRYKFVCDKFALVCYIFVIFFFLLCLSNNPPYNTSNMFGYGWGDRPTKDVQPKKRQTNRRKKNDDGGLIGE